MKKSGKFITFTATLFGVLMILVLGSVFAQPMFNFEPPHVTDPWNDAECLQCHYMEPHNFGIVPLARGAEQEALCKTCHNPTGVAASMSNVGNHRVNDNSTIIDCSTCHDPHARQESFDSHSGLTAYNLKLIRSAISTEFIPDVLNPVIFQQRPDHFAFDEGNSPYNGVCQSCHTATNHHTNDGTVDHEHYYGNDCTSCHVHEEGFLFGAGACSACHGFPPTQDTLGGPDGIVNLPLPTGSQTAGDHATHATASGYNYPCETCHFGGMPQSPISGNNQIQMGFNAFGQDGTGATYDGQILDAPYSYEATNNTTVTTGGTMTCDNLYCHGTLSDGTDWGSGNNTTPQWGGTLACGDCHLATSDNASVLGSHEVHTSSTELNIQCDVCHSTYPDDHVNGQSNLNFSSDPVVAGAAYDGTSTMLDSYGQCSNLYCHSNVQSSDGMGGPTSYTTPTWGGAALDCDACHGDPPSTGNHDEHFYSVNYHTGNYGWSCNQCHSNNTHADYNIDVGRGYTTGGAPANGYGTCTSACHTGAVWEGGRLYCYDCHGPNNACYNCHPGMSTNALPDSDPSFALLVPSAPVLVSEGDVDSETAVAVTLEWNPVAPPSGGQTQYYAEISINVDMSSPSFILNWDPTTSWTVTLDTSRAWYWRVRARDLARPGLISDWSPIEAFTINIPGTPLAPVLIPEPDITPTIVPIPPISLEWNPVTFEDPVEYYVEVDDQALMASPNFTSGWITAVSWTFQPQYYAPYWWRVKTRNALDTIKESTWSFVDNFQVWNPSGSCPFLYVWDGEKFNFQTDLYGAGKLAAKGSFGYFTPNPNDYYVLETNPVEKDGHYQMRLVEERFETDYLDELKLYVIDIPMNRSIYGEKPGFGGTLNDLQDVLHTASQVLQRPLAITHVNTGADVSVELGSSDGEYLILNEDRNIDFVYQTLEIDLGDLSAAPQIKLIIDGVSMFPDSPEGVERSSQFGPRTKLEVLEAGGQWVSVDKTIAELPKPPEFKRAFALDISDIFQTNVYKVRLTFLFKTLIDSVRFDITEDEIVSLTEVPLVSAELRSYGLSDKEHVFDEIYNYLYRENDPNHIHEYFPGNYTRFGDVTSLLSQTDDMFVIYGKGDEIDLRFSLAGPQAPGTTRKFMMYTDGYYKDAKVDVPHTVEPLPFEAMSGFPYDPAVENYPDDPEHNQYLEEYNTRVE